MWQFLFDPFLWICLICLSISEVAFFKGTSGTNAVFPVLLVAFRLWGKWKVIRLSLQRCFRDAGLKVDCFHFNEGELRTKFKKKTQREKRRNLRKTKKGRRRSPGLQMGDRGGGPHAECESGLWAVTGALRLHDTWHVSSPAVSRSPATVLQPRMPQLHTEIEMTMCAAKRGIIQNQRPRHGLCVRRDWGKQPFCLGSIRITDAKTTLNSLQANYMCWARAGAGHSLVNCSA